MRVIPRDHTAEDPSHCLGSRSWLIRLVMAPQLTEHETLQNLQGGGDDETVGALVWLGVSSKGCTWTSDYHGSGLESPILGQRLYASPWWPVLKQGESSSFLKKNKTIFPLPSCELLLLVWCVLLVQLWICLVRMSQSLSWRLRICFFCSSDLRPQSVSKLEMWLSNKDVFSNLFDECKALASLAASGMWSWSCSLQLSIQSCDGSNSLTGYTNNPLFVFSLTTFLSRL